MKKYILNLCLVLFCLIAATGTVTAANLNRDPGQGHYQINMCVGDIQTFFVGACYDHRYFEVCDNTSPNWIIKLKALRAGDTAVQDGNIIYDVHISEVSLDITKVL